MLSIGLYNKNFTFKLRGQDFEIKKKNYIKNSKNGKNNLHKTRLSFLKSSNYVQSRDGDVN